MYLINVVYAGVESQFFVKLEVVPGRKLLSLQPRCPLPPGRRVDHSQR